MGERTKSDIQSLTLGWIWAFICKTLHTWEVSSAFDEKLIAKCTFRENPTYFLQIMLLIGLRQIRHSKLVTVPLNWTVAAKWVKTVSSDITSCRLRDNVERLFDRSAGTRCFKLSKPEATSENFKLFPYRRSQEIWWELGKPVCPDVLDKRVSYMGCFIKSYVFLFSTRMSSCNTIHNVLAFRWL